ncbi:MAG: hypothetical protein Sapg2KO_48360 [Saprospiraceae bacterium]
MKSNLISIFCSLIALILLNTGNLTAQSASGRVIYKEKEGFDQKIVKENGVTFMSVRNYARIEMDDASSLFHQNSGVCESWSVPKGEGTAIMHGICMMANKNGDTYIAYITDSEKEATEFELNVKGGTGIFENLDGKGTATFMMPTHTKKEGDCCMQKFTLKYKL